jgi:hypothetical protein
MTGNPGTWSITYQLSPNNANPWENRTGSFTGYSDDAPYLASKTQSGCSRAQDVKASDGRVLIPTLVCNSYIRNFVATFTPDVVKYDCINAACVKSTQYNTPGFYQSLSQCESTCGTGCSGHCISNSDWSQIEGLANQLKNKNC